MIRGFENFKEWFVGYEECYVIIGGTACELLMTSYDMDFRATKDIDLVIILEALTPEFAKLFWEYVVNAGYEHKDKSTGETQFYRFSKPKSYEFPTMIELFSRKTNQVILPEEAVLTPIPMDEEVSSLSAILLNEAYYQFLRSGHIMLNGVTILDTPYLIPFKMKAWLDLSKRKFNGEKIDRKSIQKHKYDVFRLSELLGTTTKIKTGNAISSDIRQFLSEMRSEDIDLKQLGIRKSKEEIIARLETCYQVNSII